MPAHNPMAEKALEFQYNFMKSGGVKIIIDMLAKNNFLSNTDMPTKRCVSGKCFRKVLLPVKFVKLVCGLVYTITSCNINDELLFLRILLRTLSENKTA